MTSPSAGAAPPTCAIFSPSITTSPGLASAPFSASNIRAALSTSFFGGGFGEPFRNTLPPFITKLTRSTAEGSCKGFPGTATTSASLPFSSTPASMPRSSASTRVALCSACAGVKPHFVSEKSCFGLVPCGPTPASVPKATRTPIFCALRIISGHALPAARIFSSMAGGNAPSSPVKCPASSGIGPGIR